MLNHSNLDIETEDVQSTWSNLETKLSNIIDELAQFAPFINNTTIKSIKPNIAIKRKINIRQRLLKRMELNACNLLRDQVRNLNYKIRMHSHILKSKSIRRKILPGNCKSLWDAVKIAKDVNIGSLLDEMQFMHEIFFTELLPDAFADCFENKANKIFNEQTTTDSVFNGVRKVNVDNINFMCSPNISKAIKLIKIKNCEGHDRIPHHILVDGFEALHQPLSILFNKIYVQNTIPEQWLISKVIPIFKKGDPKNIENFSPISNLCCTS